MMIGFYLASNIFTLAFALIAIAWLFLIPYHANLAAWLSLTTYTSALILPYLTTLASLDKRFLVLMKKKSQGARK